jgi:hypothetical protein
MGGVGVREDYIRALYRLAKAAPAQWLEFVMRFDAYVVTELERGTRTSTIDMAISLGMNRRMVELRNDFREIEQLADKYKVT